MNRILLIRHGTTDLSGRVLYGRRPGIHLNEHGKAQARAVGAALKRQYAIDALVSSPLERSLETAQPIADAYAIQIQIDEGFTEVDFGTWAGLSFGELSSMSIWQEYNRLRSQHRAPDGESMMEVQARAWRAIERASNGIGPDATIAIVTHGDVIRCLLLLLLGISIDQIHRLEVVPASVSEVMIGGANPVVRGINRVFE